MGDVLRFPTHGKPLPASMEQHMRYWGARTYPQSPTEKFADSRTGLKNGVSGLSTFTNEARQ